MISVLNGITARSTVGRMIAEDANEKASIFMAAIYPMTLADREAEAGLKGQDHLGVIKFQILMRKAGMWG
jgi:hypothetical protein